MDLRIVFGISLLLIGVIRRWQAKRRENLPPVCMHCKRERCPLPTAIDPCTMMDLRDYGPVHPQCQFNHTFPVEERA